MWYCFRFSCMILCSTYMQIEIWWFAEYPFSSSLYRGQRLLLRPPRSQSIAEKRRGRLSNRRDVLQTIDWRGKKERERKKKGNGKRSPAKNLVRHFRHFSEDRIQRAREAINQVLADDYLLNGEMTGLCIPTVQSRLGRERGKEDKFYDWQNQWTYERPSIYGVEFWIYKTASTTPYAVRWIHQKERKEKRELDILFYFIFILDITYSYYLLLVQYS